MGVPYLKKRFFDVVQKDALDLLDVHEYFNEPYYPSLNWIHYYDEDNPYYKTSREIHNRSFNGTCFVKLSGGDFKKPDYPKKTKVSCNKKQKIKFKGRAPDPDPGYNSPLDWQLRLSVIKENSDKLTEDMAMHNLQRIFDSIKFLYRDYKNPGCHGYTETDFYESAGNYIALKNFIEGAKSWTKVGPFCDFVKNFKTRSDCDWFEEGDIIFLRHTVYDELRSFIDLEGKVLNASVELGYLWINYEDLGYKIKIDTTDVDFVFLEKLYDESEFD